MASTARIPAIAFVALFLSLGASFGPWGTPAQGQEWIHEDEEEIPERVAWAVDTQAWTLEVRSGVTVPTGNFDDMVQAGPAVGAGIAHWLSERVALRVDGEREAFVARRQVAEGAAPDVRLWSLAGGIQLRFVDAGRAPGWTTNLSVGAGATRFDTDAFTLGEQLGELNRTYFSSHARVNVDFRATPWLGAFAEAGTRLVLVDEDDMVAFEMLAPGEVERFSGIWSFPFTVGARLIF